MTERRSVRARARALYRAKSAAPSGTAATPLPNPPPQGGRGPALPRERAPAAASETKLTARVRALYEDSVVPVREIAALAGVTERTIYKYAAKHGWRPRYAWGAREPGGGRPRRRPARAGFAPAKFDATTSAPSKFAPIKGAGGRFIARADKDKPVAAGLKATDPQGGARAAAQCRRAERHARAAQAQADAERRFAARLRAVADTNRALGRLNSYLAQRAAPATARQRRADALIGRTLALAVELAVSRWEAGL